MIQYEKWFNLQLMKISAILISCSFFLLTQSTLSVAQDLGLDVEARGATPEAKAKGLFDIGDYKNAQIAYTVLLAQDPESMFLNWRLGQCHLYQNIRKSTSIPYLRKVTRMETFDDEVLYDMGLAFMYNEQIDSALLFFNKYSQSCST